MAENDNLPYMPKYGHQFYGDDKVLVMDFAQKGMYDELLWRQWQNGSIPGDPELIRAMLKPEVHEADSWAKFISQIDAIFPLMNGDPYSRQNPKLENVRANAIEVLEKKRQGGKKGGIASAEARAKLKESSTTAEGKPKESLSSAQQGEGKGEGKGGGSVVEKNYTTTTDVADEFNAEREYLLRCVTAANAGMRGNPALEGERPMLLGHQFDIVTWWQDGIPCTLAQEVINEIARTYRPKNGPHDYLSSLKYFDRPLREKWEQLETADKPVITREEIAEIRKELKL